MAEIDAVKIAVRECPSSENDDPNKRVVTYDDDYPNVIIIKDRPFAFDHVLKPETTQDHLYELLIQPMFEKFLKGYNCTAFAYGQTGTGKTHTMGFESKYHTHDQMGILTRFLIHLFTGKVITKNAEISMSFVEIYQEKVYDLISSDNNEPIIARGNRYTGSSKLTLTNLDQSHKVLEQGTKNRHVRPTKQNSKSSRSHAVITIYYSDTNNSDEKIYSSFNFVDLAGSEGVRRTGNEGLAMSEGVHINQGLLTIGKVLFALSQGQKSIPYRDSVLTNVLQDSLNCNSYMLLIACISGRVKDSSSTLSTMNFAQNAKKCKHSPQINKVLAKLRPLKTPFKVNPPQQQNFPTPSLLGKRSHLDFDADAILRSNKGESLELNFFKILMGLTDKEKEKKKLKTSNKTKNAQCNSKPRYEFVYFKKHDVNKIPADVRLMQYEENKNSFNEYEVESVTSQNKVNSDSIPSIVNAYSLVNTDFNYTKELNSSMISNEVLDIPFKVKENEICVEADPNCFLFNSRNASDSEEINSEGNKNDCITNSLNCANEAATTSAKASTFAYNQQHLGRIQNKNSQDSISSTMLDVPLTVDSVVASASSKLPKRRRTMYFMDSLKMVDDTIDISTSKTKKVTQIRRSLRLVNSENRTFKSSEMSKKSQTKLDNCTTQTEEVPTFSKRRSARLMASKLCEQSTTTTNTMADNQSKLDLGLTNSEEEVPTFSKRRSARLMASKLCEQSTTTTNSMADNQSKLDLGLTNSNISNDTGIDNSSSNNRPRGIQPKRKSKMPQIAENNITFKKLTELGNPIMAKYFRDDGNTSLVTSIEDHRKAVLDLINKGNLKELQILPVIGQKMAFKIISHRNIKGKFRNLKQLQTDILWPGTSWSRFTKDNYLE